MGSADPRTRLQVQRKWVHIKPWTSVVGMIGQNPNPDRRRVKRTFVVSLVQVYQPVTQVTAHTGAPHGCSG